MVDYLGAYNVVPADIREAAYGLTIPEGATVDAQLQVLIDKAAARLDGRIPSLPRRVRSDEVAIAVVQGVIEDMVLRVIRNPKARRSLGLDDWQETIDNSTTTGLLYVSPDEFALLAPTGSTRGRFGSVRIGVPPWRLPGA